MKILKNDKEKANASSSPPYQDPDVRSKAPIPPNLFVCLFLMIVMSSDFLSTYYQHIISITCRKQVCYR